MIWVETSIDSESFQQWDAIGRPETFGRIFVAGRDAGPGVARWSAAAGVTSLLVLARVEDSAPARRLTTIVSGARPMTPCALRLTSSNAVAALVRAADTLRMPVDPVAAIAVLEAALANTVSGMWLKSISRLHRPPPTLGQYLRSLSPFGAGHIVVQTPNPAVQPEVPIELASRPTALLIGTDCDDADIPNLLDEAFPRIRVCRVTPIGDSKRVHGSAGVEFMVDGPPVFRLDPTHRRCPSCGFAVYSVACPYCHLVATTSRSEAA